MSAPSGDDSVAGLIAVLKAKVAERESTGQYPPGLEDDLDAHFDRIAVHHAPKYSFHDLREKVGRLGLLGSFNPRTIRLDTRVPGGTQLHRAIAKVVSRQTSGILEQMQGFSDGVRAALWEVVTALESPSTHTHADLAGELDAIFERLAAYERASFDTAALASLTKRVQALEAAKSKTFTPWFSSERFEQEFRGESADLRERYRDLARHFAESEGPVVDIGCGRGEFLELLDELHVDAQGIEIDSELVRMGVERGLPVAFGDGISWLKQTPDEALGGISLIQVVEHLSAQELVDLVALAAQKVRSGGKIVVETVNPQSLYVFAHSFFLDPTHVAPVHPAYLHFMFREAGFSSVDIEWRSPPPADDILEDVDDTSPLGGQVNANGKRLNQLLFAAQDYALIACR